MAIIANVLPIMNLDTANKMFAINAIDANENSPQIIEETPLEIKACPLSIEEFIRQMARENNIDEEKAVFIAKCESSLRPKVVGDNHLTCKKTRKAMRSRGIWQINECGHPHISDQEAFDLKWSTNWAMDVFRQGRENKEWIICNGKYKKEKGV